MLELLLVNYSQLKSATYEPWSPTPLGPPQSASSAVWQDSTKDVALKSQRRGELETSSSR